MTEDDIELEQTCFACPEQYDAFYKGRLVGYLRLRWGHFRVDFPDVGGEPIYEADLDDPFQGAFDTEEEREKYLGEAKRAILKKLQQEEEI